MLKMHSAALWIYLKKYSKNKNSYNDLFIFNDCVMVFRLKRTCRPSNALYLMSPSTQSNSISMLAVMD
jgi:hypothetical protein